MKIHYDDHAKYKMFADRYLPILARLGISQYNLPKLSVYIDKEYPDFGNDQFGGKHQHVLRRSDQLLMYLRLLTLQDALAQGMSEDLYNRYMITTDTVPHEFGHALHFTWFGSDGSDTWQTVWRLMGRADPLDFVRGQFGAMAGQCPAYEAFANYFADMVMMRTTNIALMQYLWQLMGVMVLVFKLGSKDYTRNGITKQMPRPLPIVDGTSYLPNRLLIEELQGVTLRDVVYVEQTKEIVVIGGNKNEYWEGENK
jgi:hypothetical protein